MWVGHGARPHSKGPRRGPTCSRVCGDCPGTTNRMRIIAWYIRRRSNSRRRNGQRASSRSLLSGLTIHAGRTATYSTRASAYAAAAAASRTLPLSTASSVAPRGSESRAPNQAHSPVPTRVRVSGGSRADLLVQDSSPRPAYGGRRQLAGTGWTLAPTAAPTATSPRCRPPSGTCSVCSIGAPLHLPTREGGWG